MEYTITSKLIEEQIALDEAWAGYHAEEDPFYQDLYITSIEDATAEISRLESLLAESRELENKLPL